MPRRDAGRSIALEEIKWRTWNDRIRGSVPGVSWGSLFTVEEAPGMGLVEIAPGCELPKHHHTPSEVYCVLRGTGTVRIYNKAHDLAPGTTVYIPSNSTHVTINTGDTPLLILYTFPHAAFAEVDYVIDA
ncbi:cupin domain-containing protein [Acuticoccus sediminis]|uniref:cupin domain-containing protein n=1 Tax=Acuticoccus sediminis TaxID=2184697 RepID=UPI001CFC81DD|nr:dimethylsulfonioproprionate lyase family protein [Acuticoccus sediminis]